VAPLAVFRCDASPEIGGGHVARCLVLADALAGCGWSCRFATHGDAQRTLPALETSAHEVCILGGEEMGEEDEAAALDVNLKTGCALLVVDHYGRDQRFEKAARRWAERIAVIDDLANREHDADVLVDPTPGRVSDMYKHLVPSHCRLLLGPMYAPLRAELAALRESALAQRRARPGLRRVFVGFGATDSGNMTAAAVTAIGEAMPDLAIDAVLGGGATHVSEVRSAASAFGSRVHIHVEPKSVADLMATADIGVGAAGMMSWERCCLGLPSLMAIVADNQRSNAAGLERAGAGFAVGGENGLDSRALIEALQELSDEPARLVRMAEAAAALCDGRGAERVVEALVA
jgi:UDP-2,4-diacetamido-2,4,6-trideoxy-beta-L-altropyranose hydrolase